MSTISVRSGGSSTGYHPKKLLKLPKDMPSNIVSSIEISDTLFSQIIKQDANDNVSAPPLLPAEQLVQSINAANSQQRGAQRSSHTNAFKPKSAYDKQVKIDFRRLQRFKGKS